jgi:DNA polymerase I-like protein with 3'-5' exonuclease and polymerase domains
MLCAHVLDTRQKFTGLKFQAFTQFGVRPYDKYIKQFLTDRKGTGFNRIDEAPLDSLLLYGGMDVVLTEKLYRKQLDQMTLSGEMNEKHKLAKAYQFFHEGNLAFCEIESTGIRMDEEYYEQKDGELQARITSLYRKLADSAQAKKFREEVGRDISLKGTNSNKDLKKLLTEVLGLEMDRTLKDNISTDEKSLSQLNLPFTNNLLKIRKLEKIHGTYFAEFKREMCRGRMFPFFSLNIPRSLRSSSSKPNFQNIPNREEEAKKLCRSGIIPSPGNQILESDFKGIEVSIAACYTRDPTLVKHVTDPDNDMHRDCAADLWMMNREDITKDMRFFAKNCWVFPQFYGSYYGNCAEDLWEAVIEPDLKNAREEHVVDVLQDRGIDNLDTFKEHCQSVEHDFWNKRFLVYKQWKDRIQKQFRKQGYFETYFGFRFTGYLTYRQLANYPIQGTAFHCLLWTLIRLNEIRKSRKWKSKIIGQIHDSIVWDAVPEEVEEIIEVTIEVGTREIRVQHPWINVPLEIDFEITPIDGSWYEKEEIKWDD